MCMLIPNAFSFKPKNKLSIPRGKLLEILVNHITVLLN